VTTYVDSSALLKRYIAEHDSELADRLLASDPVLVTSWITLIEVRRNLGRLAEQRDLPALRQQCETDLDAFALISCTETTAKIAADISEHLGVRSLDAVHLASAQQLAISQIRFLTFDLRQAQAARALGMVVIGC
jgi:uncharacterized protein